MKPVHRLSFDGEIRERERKVTACELSEFLLTLAMQSLRVWCPRVCVAIRTARSAKLLWGFAWRTGYRMNLYMKRKNKFQKMYEQTITFYCIVCAYCCVKLH